MESNTAKSEENSVRFVDKIIGTAEKLSAFLICIVLAGIVLSLFTIWFLNMKDYAMVFVVAMLSIIPAGLFGFLVQVSRVIRRNIRPLTWFNGLMLVGSVFTVIIGMIAFLGIYAVVGGW